MDGLVISQQRREHFFDVKSQNVESKSNPKSIDNDMVTCPQLVRTHSGLENLKKSRQKNS